MCVCVFWFAVICAKPRTPAVPRMPICGIQQVICCFRLLPFRVSSGRVGIQTKTLLQTSNVQPPNQISDFEHSPNRSQTSNDTSPKIQPSKQNSDILQIQHIANHPAKDLAPLPQVFGDGGRALKKLGINMSALVHFAWLLGL